MHVLGETRLKGDDALAHRLTARCAQLGITPRREEVAYLPVIGTVDHEEDLFLAEPRGHDAGPLGIAGKARQAEPEQLDGRGRRDRPESGELSQARESAVRGDRERGADLVPAIRLSVTPAANRAVRG